MNRLFAMVLVCGSLLACPKSALASLVLYQFTGVFPDDAPTNAVMSPNSEFSIEFPLPMPVELEDFFVDDSFEVVPEVTYTLAGTSVPTASTSVVFFAPGLNNGADISFDAGGGRARLTVFDTVFYAGPESAPTLIFPIDEIATRDFDFTAATSVSLEIRVQATAIPEPSTLTLAGFVMLGLLKRKSLR